ncbi:MAG: restriction endonuclease subunit S [Desulfuromusa sp.]
MSEWREAKLKDFFKVKHGFAFKGKNITTAETSDILVTPGNFHIGGGFKSDKFKYFNAEYPNDYLLQENDIVITMTDLSKETDTLGYSAKVPKSDNEKKYLHNQRIGLIQFKNNDANSDYLYWLMRTREYQGYIIGSASGTSIMHTSPTRIEEYQFLLPPLPEQKAIAEVLSSLDDKIDLLHRQNKTLEQMAETLFRQWFVEDAGEDWAEGTIADLIEFNPVRKLARGSVVPYLEMAAISTSTFSPNGWYKREFKSGTKFINGDTLLARITPCLENGKTAYVTFLEDGQVAWGSTEYIIMRPKGDLHPFFAYTLARNSDFREYAEGCLEGSSGRQRVNVDHLKNYEIKSPSSEVVTDFNLVAEAVVEKLHQNSLQIRTLETLRNILLPKLMCGEARIASNG